MPKVVELIVNLFGVLTIGAGTYYMVRSADFTGTLGGIHIALQGLAFIILGGFMSIKKFHQKN